MTNTGEKGRQYERDMARMLSRWWSEGQFDDWFWRTDTSGGRATQRAKSGLATANAVGDLSARTEEAALLLKYFVIEIKRGYNDLEVLPLLDKDKHKSNHLLNWWSKLTKEGMDTNRKPLLIFKRDRAEPCIVMYRNLFWEFEDWFGTNASRIIMFPAYIQILCMMRLGSFFTWAYPQDFKELLKKYENGSLT